MSHATDIEICSNALLLIGHNTIASFTEGGAGAKVAANFYQQTYEALLTRHPWRFAIGQKQLSRLVDTPLNTWAYAFQLPSDFLAAIKVYPQGDYEIFEDMIYSNQDALELDYIFKPDESRLPAYFVEAMELRLASKFAFPVTSNKSTGELYHAMFLDALKVAKSKDSQGRPNKPIVDSPFTDTRF